MDGLSTRYGHFSDDGTEFIVTDPRTPAPWINILAPEGGYGAAVSASGGGFSWVHHPGAHRVTRWHQDMVRDEAGRYLYLVEDGAAPRSFAWTPTRQEPGQFRCHHGPGFTTWHSEQDGLRMSWTVFVPPGQTLEVWDVRVSNTSSRARSFRVISYLEWSLGVAPDPMREFEKCFYELERTDGVLLASRRLWRIPSKKGHYNERWPFVAFHDAGPDAKRFAIEKARFLGLYGSFATPALELTDTMPRTPGATDAIAAQEVPVTLAAGAETRLTFTVGVADDRPAALALARRYRTPAAVDEARAALAAFWREQTAGLRVETPDAAVNVLANHWLPYQVFSSREWGRTSYYWHGGSTGAREIQDALALVVHRPDLAKERLRDNLAHIASDGTVPHHWDPVTGELGKKAWSDDMLWTAFVLIEYVKETGDLSLLDARVPWLDGGEASGVDHVDACVRRVLSQTGASGLPLILEGDWNDGLSAVGKGGKGESVWLGHFLHGILLELVPLMERVGRKDLAERYARDATKLRNTINDVAWDGAWYRRARTDDGTWLGTSGNTTGRVYLNAQAWAITMGVVPPERRADVLAALDQHVYGVEGPVLFSPPYEEIDERIGYLTRYNPGVRENGGVYTHAVNWAIWAECVVGRADKAWSAFNAIAPPVRGRQPERYAAEPYVTAGNIEGPPSPYAGRGGWTWFSSSGAWLYKVLTERLLGIRPELDGLTVAPVLPTGWSGFRATRRFRGATYEIEVRRSADAPSLSVDGVAISGDRVPPHGDGGTHRVVVNVK